MTDPGKLRRRRENLYRGLLAVAPDAMLVVDEDAQIVLTNASAESQFGYGHDELVGKPVEDIIPAGFVERFLARRRITGDPGSVPGGETPPADGGIELTGRRKNGSCFPIEVTLGPSDGGEDTLVAAAIRDISVRKSAEASLALEAEESRATEEELYNGKERAEVTLNCIGDAVVSTDSNGNITFLNVVGVKLTGWSPEEAFGKPMVEVLRMLDATTRQTIPNPMELAVDRDLTVHLPSNCVLVRRDGTEIPIEDSVAPIHDRNGRATGVVIVFRDASAAQVMTLKLAHSAQHDALTGLPNRSLFHERVNQAISLAARHRNHVAVLFLDLDGFKEINDSLGHLVGDGVLKAVAKSLTECVRGSDMVSRQGGDEFVVLLSEVHHAQDAAISARRMLAAVADVRSVDGHDVILSTSIGVSLYPGDGRDAKALIQNADAAMYSAKEGGRRDFQFYKPPSAGRTARRPSPERDLENALLRQEFSLHYQPKVHLTTGAITGAEALIRWTHPERGALLPAQFIPMAEDCGMILPIGNWALREACRQTRAWISTGLSLSTIAVNISAMEFRADNFLEGVRAILQETGLAPESLEIELTESVLMRRAESAVSILRALRDQGIQVAVDDFGTGYSSLSYLRTFPLDALKIDQSFVRAIGSAPDDTTILTMMILLGRSLKLRVVAEGVETREEAEFLRTHQCDEAQGYYFSRPLPPLEFLRLLESGMPLLPDTVRNARSVQN